MAAQRENPESDRAAAEKRPIELVTENGFCILRCWEIDRTPPPNAGQYPFLVRNPFGLERAREITVEVTDEAVAQIERHTRGRIWPGSSFWIYCAERHLANYVWEHDDYPPAGILRIEQLDPDDCDQADRWETT